MSSIKAVLFDMDGTLHDTRDAVYGALQETFAIHNLAVPSREQMAPYIHHHNEVHAALAGQIPQNKFIESYFSEVFKLLPAAPQYPYTNTVLEKLKSDGFDVGLVTGAIYLRDYFAESGTFKDFDVVIGPDDITKPKPDPQGITFALQKLGLAPHEAVMVGDLATDIKAAKTAKLRAAIGITHGFGTRDSLESAGADHIIDSLSELPKLVAQL